MTPVKDFPLKLNLALQAASLSRVGVAQALRLDKSLVGRWLAGSVHPTEHNLSRLTELLATKGEGFCLADWHTGVPELSQRLGLKPTADQADAGLLPEDLLGPLGPFIAQARQETAVRGAAYEGFWRTSRPSLLMPERLFHDYARIRRGKDGLLKVRMLGAGLTFRGFAFPLGSNLFVILYDATGGTPVSAIFKGVTLPRAMVLDGLLLLAALDGNRTPAALPVVLERIGELSDDGEADDARLESLEAEAPHPIDPVEPKRLHSRLYRPVEPGNADGGEPFLSVGSLESLSRGATLAGLSG